MKWMSYDIVEGTNGKAMIKIIQADGQPKLTSPEEISAVILAKMKYIAESYLGQKVSKAVITVPAYFTDSQRKATMDAGKKAGLDVLRIINEPTAAALGYNVDKMQGGKEQNIIVYDFGGGTFDVSLLTVTNGEVKVRSTNGDTHLGGEDFDQKLCEHFIKQYNKKTGKDIKTNPRALQKLKIEVEKAKRELSFQHSTKISIENLHDGEDFEDTITRARFEQLCMDLFKKTIRPVEQVLIDAKMNKKDIHKLLLVGGSTRIPKIQEMITSFFDGLKPDNRINPDEAVAYGAAVQGGMLQKKEALTDGMSL